jgi:hypothetical protein
MKTITPPAGCLKFYSAPSLKFSPVSIEGVICVSGDGSLPSDKPGTLSGGPLEFDDFE